MITRLYPASLKQSQTPDTWREAQVTPVFRKGERYKAVNYRPVSLICILCKRMEYILASSIKKHLNSNNLLCSKHHGFRSKLSYQTQLIEFSADVLQTVQDRKQCDAIVMDFSIAFDKMSHGRFLFKLALAGVDEKTTAWVRPFLACRT
jgi:hypothetical protein